MWGTGSTDGEDMKVKSVRKDFLVGQQLRPRVSNAEGMGLIPGQGTKILNAMWYGKKKKKKCM